MLSVYADLPGMRASDSPQTTIPPSLLITPYRPDIVIYNQMNNSVALLELTCPLDSVHHLESARERKQKTEYQQILSEFDRLGILCSYYTIELSVLGHYLPSALSSFQNCVNFIQTEIAMTRSNCRRIFDLAAVASISSSRRIFMAKDCTEWSVENWTISTYFNFLIVPFLAIPTYTAFCLFCGSMCRPGGSKIQVVRLHSFCL